MTALTTSLRTTFPPPRREGPRPSRPAILVTVDTEEEFDWNQPPAAQTPRITHTPELPRLQDALERVGARPTYVIDHPLLCDDASVRVLSELHARGTCELGAHLHPWVNPPVIEEPTLGNTYLCNLPPSLQHEKLAVLTDAFRTAFGHSPTAFKAGRYGWDPALARMLAALGYVVDGSPVAYTDFSGDGGPDFRSVGNAPFMVGDLLEVPCSVPYTRRNQAASHRLHQAAERLRKLRLVGVLWHTRLLRKIFLSPEVHALPDLLRGIDALGAAGSPVMQLVLHSPSIVPGNTPYVRTLAERDRLLDALVAAVEHARRKWNAIPLTLTELARSLAAPRLASIEEAVS